MTHIPEASIGPPAGAAGGVLSGSYPNPGFAVDMATQVELDAETASRISGDAATLASADSYADAALATHVAAADPHTQYQKESEKDVALGYAGLNAAAKLTAILVAALTFGTHLQAAGASYNNSAATTISTDATAAATASTIVARDGSGGTALGGTLTAQAATFTTVAASGLVSANAGATVASGQTFTLTGATVAGAPTWSSTQTLNTTGFAATLQTTRTIWGQNFNGSANVNGAFSGATTGVFSDTLTLSQTAGSRALTISVGGIASWYDAVPTEVGRIVAAAGTWTFALQQAAGVIDITNGSSQSVLTLTGSTKAGRAFGAWTFDTNITQTAGTAALQVITGTSLGLTNDITLTGTRTITATNALSIAAAGTNLFLEAPNNVVVYVGANIGIFTSAGLNMNSHNLTGVTSITASGTGSFEDNVSFLLGAIARMYNAANSETFRMAAVTTHANFTLIGSGADYQFLDTSGNPIVVLSNTSKTGRAYGAWTFDTNVTQTAGTLAAQAITGTTYVGSSTIQGTVITATGSNSRFGSGGGNLNTFFGKQTPTADNSTTLFLENSNAATTWAIGTNLFVGSALEFTPSTAPGNGTYTTSTLRLLPGSGTAILTGAALSGVTTYTSTGRISNTVTTEQTRFAYDASNYISTTVDSTGNAIYNLVGTGSPFGHVWRYNGNNLMNLGSNSQLTFSSIALGGITSLAGTGPISGFTTVTFTGDLGTTGTRITKGWFTDLTVTNAISGSVTGSSGSTTGSAATLSPGRNINGVLFDGSAPITVTAAAGTLSGATLAAGVTASSLTSVGILASPHVTTLTVDSGGIAITAGTLAAQAVTATTYNGTGAITTTVTGNAIVATTSGDTTLAVNVVNNTGGTLRRTVLGMYATGTRSGFGFVGTESNHGFEVHTNDTIRATVSAAGAWDFQSNSVAAGATTVTTLAGTGALSGFTTGAFSSTLSTAGALAVAATQKFYLDGVAASGDSYLWESAANILDVVAGGVTSRFTSAHMEQGTRIQPKGTNTTGITTSFVTIYDANANASGVWVIANGTDGSNAFVDVLVGHSGGSFSVISSTGIAGAPTVRTYQLATGHLQVKFASGGPYTVRTAATELGASGSW